MSETEAPRPRGRALALLAVGLSALWVLAGALMKLFKGTPKDLPEVVRDLTPFALDTTYVLVIGVELSIVALAFLRPKLAWPVLVALFVFFDWILVEMLRAGAESCGCFGASIKVDPRVMLAVDSALLLFLVATRPWKTLGTRSGSSWLLLVPLVAASFVAPWLYIRARMDVAPIPIPVDGGAANGTPGGAAPVSSSQFVMMYPEKWVQQNVHEIEELTKWVASEKMPLFGKIVLWRQSCEHCAAHLAKMAAADDGAQPLLLVQLKDDLESERMVTAMPSGPHVTEAALPDGLGVVVTTPWEIHVEGGVVTAAIDESDAK